MTGSGTRDQAHQPSPRQAELMLALLGGFTLLRDRSEVFLPTNARKVLAALCIRGPGRHSQLRSALAERLWATADRERAQANLRTALWRIRQADLRLVTTMHDHVRLGPAVGVDVHDSIAQAERLLSEETTLASEDTRVEPLTRDLLPGWEDDWLLLERERVRQIHLHALEALSSKLLASGRYGKAIEAALAAVACEPLRESAHIALIAAHLNEGNFAEAHRHYSRYRQILWDELRISPSHPFDQLVRRLGRPAHPAPRLRGSSTATLPSRPLTAPRTADYET